MSSMVPLTSPPSTWTIRIFIRAAEVARERASNLSPWTMSTSGRNLSRTSGSLTMDNPIDSTMAASSSPRTMVCSLLSMGIPSCSIYLYVDLLENMKNQKKNVVKAVKGSCNYARSYSTLSFASSSNNYDVQ